MAFWTSRFPLLIALSAGAIAASVWLILGGFPRGAASYARVPVPGQQIVRLPAGTLPVSYENDLDCPECKNSQIYDEPPGMSVRITGLGSVSEQPRLQRLSTHLYASKGSTRGHESYGRLHVAKPGRYLIETSDSDAGGLRAAPDPQLPSTPSRSSGAAILVGRQAWNPFGSELLGVALCFAAFMGLAELVLLTVRRLTGAGALVT